MAARQLSRIVVWVIAWVGAATLVLALHGFFPGLAQPQAAMLVAAGTIECLHRSGLAALYRGCTVVGGPAGFPMLTGAPELYLGWLLRFLPGIDAWDAHQVSNAIIHVISLVAGFGLMRRWGAPSWVALGTSTVYLTSLSVLYMNGFGYTFTGFVLLPAYLLTALVLLGWCEERRWVAAGAGALALAFVMVFTDGYAYFAGSLVVGVTGLRWLFTAPAARRTRLIAAGLWGAANLLAVGAYLAYVPGPTKQSTVPIGTFRYLGLDVWTLAVPQPTVWWPGWIGWHVTVPHLWGDGSNIYANYAGYLTLALAACYLIRGPERRAAGAWVLAIAGAIALVLSLGPALKVHDVAATATIDVPARLTTLPLPPLRWLYQHVPGFNDERATYRWFIVTRFSLVFLAGLAVAGLARNRRLGVRVLAIVIGVAAVAETLPNIPEHLHARRASARQIATIRHALLPDARRLIGPRDVVLALPASNDFLATAIVPFTGATTYNVAGDKNLALARRAWPHDIRAAANAYGTRDASDRICDAFRNRRADVVLLPYFSMFSATFAFPPAPRETIPFRKTAAALAADPRFVSESGSWMRTLRPRRGFCGR